MGSFRFNETYQDGEMVVYSPSRQGGWIKPDNPEVRQEVYQWRAELVRRGLETEAGEDVLFHVSDVIFPNNGNGPPKKDFLRSGTRVRCLVRVHRGMPENLRQRIVANPVEVTS